MDLNAHIEYLAATNDIRVLNDKEAEIVMLMHAINGGGVSWILYQNSFSGVSPSGRKVLYVDDNSDDPIVKYFIGLHEIGHQALGHVNADEDDFEVVVENEINAWKWALEHSIIEPTDAVYCDMMAALLTYTDHLEQINRKKL